MSNLWVSLFSLTMNTTMNTKRFFHASSALALYSIALFFALGAAWNPTIQQRLGDALIGFGFLYLFYDHLRRWPRE